MEFHGREESYLLGMSLDEMKIMYCSLWNDLKQRGTLGVDEEASDLLHDLQTVLQKEAYREEVDISIHSEWTSWVGLENSNCGL